MTSVNSIARFQPDLSISPHSYTCLFLLLFSLFFWRKKLYMSAKVANCSNISGQPKETSGSKAYTARLTTGEAALPWQAIRV